MITDDEPEFFMLIEFSPQVLRVVLLSAGLGATFIV